MSQRIDNLETKIDNLEQKIDNLEQKIDDIYNLLSNNVVNSCDKMNNHINFIENVYDKIKMPMFFIINKIKYLSEFKKIK